MFSRLPVFPTVIPVITFFLMMGLLVVMGYANIPDPDVLPPTLSTPIPTAPPVPTATSILPGSKGSPRVLARRSLRVGWQEEGILLCSRLRTHPPLVIALGNDTGAELAAAESISDGYLPDLARDLNQRITGTAEPMMRFIAAPSSLLFSEHDLYSGPLLHDWESQVDFAQTFQADGLAMVARSGSEGGSIEHLHQRPVALIETDEARNLYDQALAEAGVEPALFPLADVEAAAATLIDNRVDTVLLRGYPTARLLAASMPGAVLAPGRQSPILPLAIALPAYADRRRIGRPA